MKIKTAETPIISLALPLGIFNTILTLVNTMKKMEYLKKLHIISNNFFEKIHNNCIKNNNKRIITIKNIYFSCIYKKNKDKYMLIFSIK